MRRFRPAMLKRLLRNQTALAATEFAISFPIVLSLGLTGLELANRAIVQMQINQLAIHVADNASRIGDQSMLENRRIYEADIQDLFYGAELQAGAHLDLYGRGRIILSSQEVVPGTEADQYIHWQRCMGAKNAPPRYGSEGDGLAGNFPGMGPTGEEVIAFPDDAVMFVEVTYDYDPIIGNPYGFPSTIISSASFTVRDNRDLSQLYQRDPNNPDTVADCGTFGSTTFSGDGSGGGSTGGSSTGGSSSGGTSSGGSGGASSGGASSGGASSGGASSGGASSGWGGGWP